MAMTKVLIVDVHADHISRPAARRVSRSAVRAVPQRTAADGDLSGIDALICFGIEVDDSMLRRRHRS